MENKNQTNEESCSRLASDDLLCLTSLKKDAVEYGNALNDAGWAAIEEWQNLSVEMPPHLWNNLKAGIRAAILKYIEAHETEKA